MADIMTIKQASEKWGLSIRRINDLVLQGRIKGAFKVGTSWAFPADTEKPPDARVKSGKYKKDPSEWKRNKKAANKDGERK